uniref:Putative 52 kDa repressor of the inhibitor of the protein kinase-like isoform x6 n=1 Tax=Culex tarsalis TaxID=7177 RepID=A0A1Q3F0W4_CULTA
MPIKCSFHACTNESESSTVSFHKFPDEPESCEKWVDFCQSDELNERFVLEGPQALRFRFVCSDHFRPTCYIDPKYTFKGLRKLAVPTVEKAESLKSQNTSTLKEPSKPKKSAYNTYSDAKSMKVKALQRLESQRITAEPVSVEMMQSCQCDIDDEFRVKFLEELTRGEQLVRELSEMKDKTKAMKKPLANCERSIQVVDNRIKAMSRRLAELEQKHGIQVELSSDDEDEDAEDVPNDTATKRLGSPQSKVE